MKFGVVTRISLHLLIVTIGAYGQNAPTTSTARVDHVIDCIDHPDPDLTPVRYVDRDDGIEFSYPAVLFADQTQHYFQDTSCGRVLQNSESVHFAVTLAAHAPHPFTQLWQGDEISTESLGGQQWTVSTRPGHLQACTYAYEEQVCFEGRRWSPDPLSSGVVQTIHQMMSSLVFHPSMRMDAQIAALKVGQKFGPLTIRRILDRPALVAAAKSGDDTRSYGQIEFTGTLTWNGDFENDGTMNSGPDWEFSPDFDDPAQWPFPLGRERLGFVRFTNDRVLDRGLSKSATHSQRHDQGSWRLVVDHISVLLTPDATTLSVHLVRMVQEKASTTP